MSLSPKQLRFVQEYLVDLNGKRAAIAAGYSAKTAEVTASKMLRIPKVQAEIQEGQKAKEKLLEVSKEKVLKEYLRIAFSDIKNVMKWDAQYIDLIPSDDIGPDVSAAIQEVSIKTKYTDEGEMIIERKVKLYDKPRALEMLGKHLGLFEKKEGDDTNKPFTLAYPNPRGKNAS
jgi:phage terminase small subunit